MDFKDIWEKNNNGLVTPKLFESYDESKRKFFIYDDSSTIVYMIMKKNSTTYCIPRKYLEIKNKKYYITEPEKLIPVSCYTKNKYEKFIFDKFIAN